MSNQSKVEARLQHILLADSRFHRSPNISEEDMKNAGFEIEVNIREIKGNNTVCDLLVAASFKAGNETSPALHVVTAYVAGFEFINEPSVEDRDAFLNINGAAILFPYVREHIQNLCMRGQITPSITLPVTDFVSLYKRKLDEKKSNKRQKTTKK